MAILTTTNEGLNFIGGTTFIQTGTTTLMAIATNGNIQFSQYGAGTLVTDVDGNITASTVNPGTGVFVPLAGGSATGSAMTGRLFTPSISVQNQINTTSAGVEINYENGDGTIVNFKDFYVRDGKNAIIIKSIGSTKLTTFYGNVSAPQFFSTSNNTGQNYKIGDDVWIGDINVANTFRVQGSQTPGNGYITFGNASNTQLGRAGTGPLTWGGDMFISGLLQAQINTNSTLATGTGWNLNSTYLGQSIYSSGGGDNNGSTFDSARYKQAQLWGRSGTTWTDLGNVAAMLAGNNGQSYSNVTLVHNAYEEYIIFMSTSMGYTFINNTTLTHATQGNTMDLYLESKETVTDPYEAGWTTITSVTSINSWPGGSSITKAFGIGGGSDNNFRLRIVPNWSSNATNYNITLGSLQMFTSYGNPSSAYTTTWDGTTKGIVFTNYNSTNNTGTPTYLLGTDASGKIVKTLSFDPPIGTTQFFNQSSSYNNFTPGVTGYGNVVMDTSVSYYDTGKNVTTGTRGLVWTGKHYILTDHSGDVAKFYDNNFDLITNPQASTINLPAPSSGGNVPHGAAWDGRYLYCITYSPMKIMAYDLDNGTTTATIVSETDISSYSTTTYDIEYAEGHLYTCADGKVSKFKVEGKTITHVFTSSVMPGGIDAQAITYDGSYLWFTQNGQNAFKVSLDCALVATITTGLPADNVAWAWNGQNIATVNYSTGDVYIVNTAKTRFDTEEFLVMGGYVGIGVSVPETKFHVKGGADDNEALLYVENTHGSGGVFHPAALFKNTNSNHSYGTVAEFRTDDIAGTDRPSLLFSNGHTANNWSVGQGVYSANDNFAIGFRSTHPNASGTWSDPKFVILTSGKVGIGTSTPDALLEISGNAGADPGPITNPTTFRITDSGNAATGAGDMTNDWGKIEFYSEDQSSSGPSVQAQIGTIYDNIYSTASNLAFKTRTTPSTALTERMRIIPNGNVGIGMTSPGTKLEISGNNSARNTLQNILTINGGTNSNNVYSGFGMGIKFNGRDYSNEPRDYAYIYGVQEASSTSTAGGDPGFTSQLTFYTNTGGAVDTLPTQKMVIEANGNVGIGIINPGVKLDVASGTIRIRGDQPAGTYYYGFMYDGTNLQGTAQTNLIYTEGTVLTNTTIAEWASLRIANPNTTATGAVITNNYAIKQDSTLQKNHFAGDVGIGISTPKAKLDVNGNFCVDSKSFGLTNVFTTCLTVNLNSHTGCHVVITCFGDWGSHSSAAYRGEFFLQNGANGYSEPGIILRQDDNTSNGTDQIECQIVDSTSTANPKDFEIQIRTTATTGTTSFTGQLTYTVQGKFNSIT